MITVRFDLRHPHGCAGVALGGPCQFFTNNLSLLGTARRFEVK